MEITGTKYAILTKTGQSATGKKTRIEFKKYAECRF